MNVTFESSETTYSPYEQHLTNLYGDLTTKITAAVIHTAIQVGGGFLWFGIAHFEKFGGDPCKRSISNQLISYIVLSIIVFIIIINRSILLVRIVYGCLPNLLAEMLTYCRFFNMYSYVILIMINMIYKCLQLFHVDFTASLNDDFWSLVCVVITIACTFIITCSEYMLGLYYTQEFQFLTCAKMDTLDNSRYGNSTM